MTTEEKNASKSDAVYNLHVVLARYIRSKKNAGFDLSAGEKEAIILINEWSESRDISENIRLAIDSCMAALTGTTVRLEDVQNQQLVSDMLKVYIYVYQTFNKPIALSGILDSEWDKAASAFYAYLNRAYEQGPHLIVSEVIKTFGEKFAFFHVQ
jgi:hypothetical protein